MARAVATYITPRIPTVQCGASGSLTMATTAGTVLGGLLAAPAASVMAALGAAVAHLCARTDHVLTRNPLAVLGILFRCGL